MARIRKDKENLSVLIDIQDGLFSLREKLLLIVAARQAVIDWNPTGNQETDDEIATVVCLLKSYLDDDPRGQIKELIEMTEAVVKEKCS
jgi:hypothetical protein